MAYITELGTAFAQVYQGMTSYFYGDRFVGAGSKPSRKARIIGASVSGSAEHHSVVFSPGIQIAGTGYRRYPGIRRIVFLYGDITDIGKFSRAVYFGFYPAFLFRCVKCATLFFSIVA